MAVSDYTKRFAKNKEELKFFLSEVYNKLQDGVNYTSYENGEEVLRTREFDIIDFCDLMIDNNILTENDINHCGEWNLGLNPVLSNVHTEIVNESMKKISNADLSNSDKKTMISEIRTTAASRNRYVKNTLAKLVNSMGDPVNMDVYLNQLVSYELKGVKVPKETLYEIKNALTNNGYPIIKIIYFTAVKRCINGVDWCKNREVAVKTR